MQRRFQKTILILGPTASGKSDLAIALAKKYDGEVISVDSRQVYRGMDIGSGKVTRDKKGSSTFSFDASLSKKRYLTPFHSDGIRHHLLDVASPKRTYNVTHFVRDAQKALADIRKRGKLPILCGGTGFWAQALIEQIAFPSVKPDLKLRARLGKLSTGELFKILQEKDSRRAETIDCHNKIRLIRALEIVEMLGTVPLLTVNNKQPTTNTLPLLCHSREGGNPGSTKHCASNNELRCDNLKIIALSPSKEILHTRIEKRLKERLRQGMLEEVKNLHEQEGISWKRLESFGLEYRRCALYLQNKISLETMKEGILTDSHHYAKRQLSYLRRWEKSGRQIRWIERPEDAEIIIATSFSGFLPLPAGSLSHVSPS